MECANSFNSCSNTASSSHDANIEVHGKLSKSLQNEVNLQECDVQSYSNTDEPGNHLPAHFICKVQISCRDSQLANVAAAESENSGAVKKSRGSYVCSAPGCDKKFSRHSRLEQHLRIHTGARPYVCDAPDCGRSYTRSQHLKRHKDASHPSLSEQKQLPQAKPRCSECEKDFANVYSLRKHTVQYHGRRKHECASCGQLFLKHQHLLTHLQTHTNAPAFKCEFPGCKMAFNVPSKLKRHAQVHETGRYRCSRSDECDRTFDRHVDLRRHLANDHSYECAVCGMSFQQLTRYNKHRATHEDLRLSFQCKSDGCGRCYYSLRALVSHVRDKHDNEGRLHPCLVCGKKLSTNQKLIQHQKTHSTDQNRRCTSSLRVRKQRRDKGKGRTDYRRLLSGFVSPDSESRDVHGNLIKSDDLQNEFDVVIGTRRGLEGRISFPDDEIPAPVADINPATNRQSSRAKNNDMIISSVNSDQIGNKVSRNQMDESGVLKHICCNTEKKKQGLVFRQSVKKLRKKMLKLSLSVLKSKF